MGERDKQTNAHTQADGRENTKSTRIRDRDAHIGVPVNRATQELETEATQAESHVRTHRQSDRHRETETETGIDTRSGTQTDR